MLNGWLHRQVALGVRLASLFPNQLDFCMESGTHKVWFSGAHAPNRNAKSPFSPKSEAQVSKQILEENQFDPRSPNAPARQDNNAFWWPWKRSMPLLAGFGNFFFSKSYYDVLVTISFKVTKKKRSFLIYRQMTKNKNLPNQTVPFLCSQAHNLVED